MGDDDPPARLRRLDRTSPPASTGTSRSCRASPRARRSRGWRPRPTSARDCLERARIEIREGRGYAFVDVEAPCIVLSEWYYREGGDLDLYLDLLHELAHLRQLEEGLDLWDERFEYVDRPTEIEGYRWPSRRGAGWA